MDIQELHNLGMRVLVGGLLIAVVILIYLLYRSNNKAKKLGKQRRNYLPRSSQFIPTKQGDCYDLISSWSNDNSSDNMVIHNLDIHATEAKMVIHKSHQGWIMRMYDISGNLIQEDKKITTHQLANKFYEMRRYTPPPPQRQKVKQLGTDTIEIK
jgi:hypothetical protein